MRGGGAPSRCALPLGVKKSPLYTPLRKGDDGFSGTAR